MSRNTKTLRSRLLGEDRPTKQRMVEALESRLEETEDVEYQLTSRGSLTHEEDSGTTYEKGGGDGGTLLAVTDRKLVFVVDTRTGLETADVPYTDLKDITADSGILKTTLSVRVWGRGTYSFKPKGGDKAERVAEFATNGSQAWQRVVAALQDARQHISTIATYVADGRMDAARDARDSAQSNLETAKTRIGEAQRWFRDPLEERAARAGTELSRTWMEGRFERGKRRLAEATTHTDAQRYDDAAAAFQQARDHLERALTIAIEDGFALAGDIQSTLSDLHDRLDTLRARPLTLAERSRAQAQMAESPELAVVAWEEALNHYRDALEAAWGTDIDFEGDTDALRMQIEWVVANVVRERARLAVSLEAEGDECRESGSDDQAVDHYRAALDQLAMARRLARQYRAGDVDTLETRCDCLRGNADA
jgi:tetratricopeptide (TPR) repeat protein